MNSITVHELIIHTQIEVAALQRLITRVAAQKTHCYPQLATAMRSVFVVSTLLSYTVDTLAIVHCPSPVIVDEPLISTFAMQVKYRIQMH